jgi:hypothetical protein
MRRIIRIAFGSRLYGTATPASDLDFKSVYVPDARSILLQRVKGSVSAKRPKGDGEKNYAGETDEESFSLQRYLNLLSEGQTIALDLLFAPEWAMTEPPAPEWREIVANKDRLVTKKSAAFLGYCRKQALAYGTKGSRVAAAKDALQFLNHRIVAHGSLVKLGEFGGLIERLYGDRDHMAVVPITQASGVVINHWEVCGRRLSFSASVKNAQETVAKIVAEYGQRALQAESNQGIDWKALSHAVRIGTQAIELLETGRITFPLPNAAHILDIKTGALPYQAVSEEIEDLLVKVEEAAARSVLPGSPDYAWIDDFIAGIYRKEVGSGDLIGRAREFAAAAHAGVNQVRKWTGEPYIVHPEAVVEIVKTVPHSDAMIAATLLHDVCEDTGVPIHVIRSQFGDVVAEYVWWLTDCDLSKGNRKQRKALDRERLSQAPREAQTIKVADIIDNTKSITAHDPDFSRVYLKEISALLDVLVDADPNLLALAHDQLRQHHQLTS